MTQRELELIAMLVASPLFAVIAITLCVRSLRSRRLQASAPLIASLLALAVWLCPFVHQRLHKSANQDLRNRIAVFKGEPLAALVAEFGVGQGDGAVAARYEISPWYAPFGWSAVQIYASPDRGIFHVAVDD